MEFKYVRIQGKELAENTRYAKGIFSMCHQLANEEMEKEDADLFFEIDKWFSEVLPWPEPCKRQEPVICFFKTENTEEMMKMVRPMMWLLEKYHHPYYVVYTNTPGEIVYEDPYQVCCKVEEPVIMALQPSWSPKE